VRKLDEHEKNQFLDGLSDIDFNDAWDRRMEHDTKSGKLDFLAEEARQESNQNKLRPFPGT
jgi:hypothetical protein